MMELCIRAARTGTGAPRRRARHVLRVAGALLLLLGASTAPPPPNRSRSARALRQQDLSHQLQFVQRRVKFAGIRASWVSAVMCLGDSWMTGLNTAEFGHVWEIEQVQKDYRGGAWACGNGKVLGFPQIETLGTLLRKFSPQVVGLSSGVTPFLNPCKENPAECGLNAAADGASLLGTNMSSHREGLERENTLIWQARDAVDWLHARHPPEVLDGWKVITMLPTWGDQWWAKRNVTLMRDGVHHVLAFLRSKLKKAYVNLLGVSDTPSSLDDVQKETMWCKLQVAGWKKKVRFETGIVFNEMDGADAFATELNRMLLAAAERFDDGRNFVVRYRPLLRGYAFQSRLSDPFTCFHPHRSFAQELGYGLLQNMASDSMRQLATLPIYRPPGQTSGDLSVSLHALKTMGAFKRKVMRERDLLLL